MCGSPGRTCCKELPEGGGRGGDSRESLKESQGLMVRASHRGCEVPAALLKEGAKGQALCQGAAPERRATRLTLSHLSRWGRIGAQGRSFFFHLLISSFQSIPSPSQSPQKMELLWRKGFKLRKSPFPFSSMFKLRGSHLHPFKGFS